MELSKVYEMKFSKIYKLYLEKALKKDRTEEEVFVIFNWLTGYNLVDLNNMLNNDITLGEVFNEAPHINENSYLIKGSICGIKVEEITDEPYRYIRYMDKLVDELAKGRPLEKILRKENK